MKLVFSAHCFNNYNANALFSALMAVVRIANPHQQRVKSLFGARFPMLAQICNLCLVLQKQIRFILMFRQYFGHYFFQP